MTLRPIRWVQRSASPLLVGLALALPFVVVACSESSGLTDGTWTLSQFGDLPGGEGILETPGTSGYAITFDADGSVAIVADCKTAVGTYTAASGYGSMTITLEPPPVAACPEGSIADGFLADLEAVRSYGTYNLGTVLTLYHGAAGELHFDRSPDAPVSD